MPVPTRSFEGVHVRHLSAASSRRLPASIFTGWDRGDDGAASDWIRPSCSPETISALPHQWREMRFLPSIIFFLFAAFLALMGRRHSLDPTTGKDLKDRYGKEMYNFNNRLMRLSGVIFFGFGAAPADRGRHPVMSGPPSRGGCRTGVLRAVLPRPTPASRRRRMPVLAALAT